MVDPKRLVKGTELKECATLPRRDAQSKPVLRKPEDPTRNRFLPYPVLEDPDRFSIYPVLPTGSTTQATIGSWPGKYPGIPGGYLPGSRPDFRTRSEFEKLAVKIR